MNDMNRQFVGVWQHRTSGDRYIVESDLDYNVLAAVGPVNHTDIATMLDTGDWANDPELAADLNAHADEYRTLDDDDLVALNLSSVNNKWRKCPRCDGSGKIGDNADQPCLVCGGVGGWYENPKDHVIGP